MMPTARSQRCLEITVTTQVGTPTTHAFDCYPYACMLKAVEAAHHSATHADHHKPLLHGSHFIITAFLHDANVRHWLCAG